MKRVYANGIVRRLYAMRFENGRYAPRPAAVEEIEKANSRSRQKICKFIETLLAFRRAPSEALDDGLGL